jgi:predicted peroxiredoxin
MIILLQIGTQEYGEAFRIARRVAAQGKKLLILFTGEGCRLVEDPNMAESLSFARLFALKEDVRKPVEGVEIIDYEGWVKLLEYCNKTACWT